MCLIDSCCSGALSFCTFLSRVYPFIMATLMPCNVKKHGKWAVVTGKRSLRATLARLTSPVRTSGATDGIGKAYCMALAKRGLNVALLSRTVRHCSSACLRDQQL